MHFQVLRSSNPVTRSFRVLRRVADYNACFKGFKSV
jgi:hypothetical protein